MCSEELSMNDAISMMFPKSVEGQSPSDHCRGRPSPSATEGTRGNHAYRVDQGRGETVPVASQSQFATGGLNPTAPVSTDALASSNICTDAGATREEAEITLNTTRPSNLRRYDRNITVPSKDPNWRIAGLVSNNAFKRKEPLGNWSSCVHPEGVLYHRGIINGIVFFTDVDVCDTYAYIEIEKAVAKLQELIDEKRQSEGEAITVSEVVLETEDFKKRVWEYYFVDHTTQHLFWLEEHSLETIIYKGAESEAHIGQLLKSEYFQHLSYFPRGQSLDSAFFAEMKGILIWGLTDSLTSIDSLTPYDVPTMKHFLKLINQMQDLNKEAPEYCVAAGARLRSVFENCKFDNFSGLPCARLTRSQSVRGEGREKPSLPFRLISFIFFRVPAKYLKSLDGIYMDKVVFQAPFRNFVKGVSDGWQQDVINAAVLFTANIAYLAIPNLLPASGKINAAATASIVSITLSLNSVIFGQLLSKKIQALQEKPTHVIAQYFSDWWSTKSGLSELAVMFSLPYVLMIWGAIAFILAILMFSFKDVEINAQIIVMIAFLGGEAMLCLWVFFEITGWRKISCYVMTQLDPLLYMMKLKNQQDKDLTTANIVNRPFLRRAALETIPRKAKIMPTKVKTVIQAMIKLKSGLRQRRPYEQVPTESPGLDDDAGDGNQLQTPETVDREHTQTESEVPLQELTGNSTDLSRFDTRGSAQSQTYVAPDVSGSHIALDLG